MLVIAMLSRFAHLQTKTYITGDTRDTLKPFVSQHTVIKKRDIFPT